MFSNNIADTKIHHQLYVSDIKFNKKIMKFVDTRQFRK